MKKHSSLYTAAVLSAVSSMGISGVPATDQPFKSPSIPNQPKPVNRSREQQRRVRQQAKKVDKHFKSFYDSTEMQVEGTLTGRFTTKGNHHE